MPHEAWQVVVEEGWPDAASARWRLALEVDPRSRTVTLGPRAERTGALDIQSGAVARSFFEAADVELSDAGAWLRGDEAEALLAELEAGFTCELLWTGDPVVNWSEAAWQAGAELYRQVQARLGPVRG